MKSDKTKWGIVGGGILGMTLALRLQQQGKQVTLFEAADEFGGLASAWQIGDITWDKHYHVTLMSDGHVRNVLRDLGLEDDINWVQTKTGFFTDGELYSMSNSVEFLKFPPLNLIEKFRLGLTIFWASKIKDWKSLENFTACEWLKKWSGKGVFDKIWKPLLRAKLGENYRFVSAAFIWAIIARMYAARRSGLKKEMFGYVKGGYSRILGIFEKKLRNEGVELVPSSAAKYVTSRDGRVTLELQNGESREFDHVVLTVPAPVVSRICPDLSPREHGLFRGIRYQGIVCASAVLKKPLAGYYVTNITDPWVPFTAVIEMTAMVDPEELGGNHLVYLPKYVDALDDEAFGRSTESYREDFWGALQQMYPHLEEDDLVAFEVSKARNVLALSSLNYSESLPPIDTTMPGVHVVNSSLICNGTLNVDETIHLAEEAAAGFIEEPHVATVEPEPEKTSA